MLYRYHLEAVAGPTTTTWTITGENGTGPALQGSGVVGVGV